MNMAAPRLHTGSTWFARRFCKYLIDIKAVENEELQITRNELFDVGIECPGVDRNASALGSSPRSKLGQWPSRHPQAAEMRVQLLPFSWDRRESVTSSLRELARVVLAWIALNGG